ncbi:hypothetical protein Pa4123_34630 [Phytohabitans aurantiacus]|uniref:Calcium-binding protein n=2 Tax=Phytohabitans aurantiacus TaxID=3016789 RepID=A0ABQ5QUD1_9ACTN|nr:hypothetical protein Pa4123_34630 [Phytohabitans aurantiacus]
MVVTLGAEAHASPTSGWTSRVAVALSGGAPNNTSERPAISADGRYVAFSSAASNLVPRDTNGTTDVFVRDTRTGVTSRVSLTGTGGQVNRHSKDPDISADGRYVAFLSYGTNILPGDPNALGNVYVRDRLAGTTMRASPLPSSGQFDNNAAEPSISADGRYVAYMTYSALIPTDTNGTPDVYTWTRDTGAVERVSVSMAGGDSDGESYGADISDDGRYVTFSSNATNLVAGDDDGWDVFVRDRRAGTTTRVSVSGDGTPGNGGSSGARISGDGRYVVFHSAASNLVDGDTNGRGDTFVRDRVTGTAELVRIAAGGGQLPEIAQAVISGNGRYVAFSAFTGGENHVLRLDRRTGATIIISLATNGAAANGHSGQPTISADGLVIAFVSIASNLVPGDTLGNEEVFLRRPRRHATHP